MTPLKSARNRVLYDNYKNSLVEWTLSPEWRSVPIKTRVRGEVHCYGSTWRGNICSGEISL